MTALRDVAALDDAGFAVWLARRDMPARVRDREWRAKQRAADIAPLSDKVVYPRRLVDAPPPPPKRRQGK